MGKRPWYETEKPEAPTRHWRATVADKVVLQMRAAYAADPEKWTIAALARRFRIGYQIALRAIYGDTYRHLSGACDRPEPNPQLVAAQRRRRAREGRGRSSKAKETRQAAE